MSAQRQTLSHGFGPYIGEDPHILILGSFPSVKSREQAFFYGHPQNRFWRVLAAVCGEETPRTLEDKQAFLSRCHIALYDVIESCSIVGSSDSSIRDVIPADLRPILQAGTIGGRIFTNGKTASRLYERYQAKTLELPAFSLPSTSPAYAACSLQSLIDIWSAALRPALEEGRAESVKNGAKKA